MYDSTNGMSVMLASALTVLIDSTAALSVLVDSTAALTVLVDSTAALSILIDSTAALVILIVPSTLRDKGTLQLRHKCLSSNIIA